MATNVYELEERIAFDPAKPCSYYGWYVSTSVGSDKATLFDSKADRESFAEWVAELTGNKDWRLPGLLLCAYCDSDGVAYWEICDDESWILPQIRERVDDELANYSANEDGSVYRWGELTEPDEHGLGPIGWEDLETTEGQ